MSAVINEELWIELVVWIFLLLFSYTKSQWWILAFCSLFGFFLSVTFISSNLSLLALGFIGLNVVLMYEALTRWD